MKKNLLYCMILILFLISTKCIITEASNREDHDRCMREVLFGKGDSYFQNLPEGDKRKDRIYDLQNASYLCIDYWNGSETSNSKKSGEEALKALKESGVKDLPKNVIDNEEKGGINYMASGLTHRNYTHKGWDHNYEKDKANWKIRKKILKNTVKRVFYKEGLVDKVLGIFKSREEQNEVDRQCDSLAAVIYYIHILEDLKEINNYEEDSSIVPLIKTSGKGENGIIDEVEKHLDVLFESQKNSSEYRILKSEIKEYRKKAKNYMDVNKTPGGLYEPENYEEYRKECVLGFLEMLRERVSPLLMKEEFFSDVFYN